MLLSSLTSPLTLFTTAEYFEAARSEPAQRRGFSGLLFRTPTVEKKRVQSSVTNPKNDVVEKVQKVWWGVFWTLFLATTAMNRRFQRLLNKSKHGF